MAMVQNRFATGGGGWSVGSKELQLWASCAYPASRQRQGEILESGSVVTWGYPERGSDSSQVQDQLRKVQHIQATERAFAAILESGAVVTCGHPHYGGDSSQVQRS